MGLAPAGAAGGGPGGAAAGRAPRREGLAAEAAGRAAGAVAAGAAAVTAGAAARRTGRLAGRRRPGRCRPGRRAAGLAAVAAVARAAGPGRAAPGARRGLPPGPGRRRSLAAGRTGRRRWAVVAGASSRYCQYSPRAARLVLAGLLVLAGDERLGPARSAWSAPASGARLPGRSGRPSRQRRPRVGLAGQRVLFGAAPGGAPPRAVRVRPAAACLAAAVAAGLPAVGCLPVGVPSARPCLCAAAPRPVQGPRRAGRPWKARPDPARARAARRSRLPPAGALAPAAGPRVGVAGGVDALDPLGPVAPVAAVLLAAACRAAACAPPAGSRFGWNEGRGAGCV